MSEAFDISRAVWHPESNFQCSTMPWVELAGEYGPGGSQEVWHTDSVDQLGELCHESDLENARIVKDAIDSCHQLGYGTNETFKYLAKLYCQRNPDYFRVLVVALRAGLI